MNKVLLRLTLFTSMLSLVNPTYGNVITKSCSEFEKEISESTPFVPGRDSNYDVSEKILSIYFQKSVESANFGLTSCILETIVSCPYGDAEASYGVQIENETRKVTIIGVDIGPCAD